MAVRLPALAAVLVAVALAALTACSSTPDDVQNFRNAVISGTGVYLNDDDPHWSAFEQIGHDVCAVLAVVPRGVDAEVALVELRDGFDPREARAIVHGAVMGFCSDQFGSWESSAAAAAS
jgi:hypothetical protein